jgi:hypothetical protein
MKKDHGLPANKPSGMSAAISLRLSCVLAALQLPGATTNELMDRIEQISERTRGRRVIHTALARMGSRGLLISARRANRSIWTPTPGCEKERQRLEEARESSDYVPGSHKPPRPMDISDDDTPFDYRTVRHLGVGEWRAQLPTQAVSSIFDWGRP